MTKIASINYHVIANILKTLQHADGWTSTPAIVGWELIVVSPASCEVQQPF